MSLLIRSCLLCDTKFPWPRRIKLDNDFPSAQAFCLEEDGWCQKTFEWKRTYSLDGYLKRCSACKKVFRVLHTNEVHWCKRILRETKKMKTEVENQFISEEQ